MLNNTQTSSLEKYKNTYNYKELVKQHSLSEYGFWKVRGEDPNCDFGGSHYQPDLGTFEGKLEDVIAYAVNLPNFWQWGAGGDFNKVSKPVKIDAESNARRIAIEQKIQALEEQLVEARKELGEL